MQAMRWLGMLVGISSPLMAAPPPGADAQALAAKIDQHIANAWKANGLTPTSPADDSEFLRRVYLDIVGRIPRVAEVRDFLADMRPDKRARVIEQLLDSASFAQHFARVYRREWLPQTVSNPNLAFFGVSFEQWLQEQIKRDRKYDQMVREIVTIPPNGIQPGQPVGSNTTQSIAFLVVHEFKPEEIASSTARLFLGVKIECAQCHDHPFDSYTRDQFWELASFFAGIQPISRRGVRVPNEAIEVRSMTIPGTERRVSATFLDGTKPVFKDGISSRITLADWMTDKKNPYFARNAVNRMWAYFFGTGLIDPLDEPGDRNPPSHPELLDDLTRGFSESGYDLRFLIRAIVNSKTYQLSSIAMNGSSNDERTYTRMRVRGLTPEQLFDSLAMATGYREYQPSSSFNSPNSPRAEFLARFSTNERLNELQTSILQALTLMNGKFVEEVTSLKSSELLASVADAPFMDTAQRIETLFLATLSRKPRPDELARLVAYVDRGGPSGEPVKALTDVFWALLNSSEFGFNH